MHSHPHEAAVLRGPNVRCGADVVHSAELGVDFSKHIIACTLQRSG